MIHSGLEALNGHWDKEEYAAGYRARFSAILDSEQAIHCWRSGWEDTDTELLESAAQSNPCRGQGKTITRTLRDCFLTQAAMPARMASPSTKNALHLGKRVGSRRT